MHLVRRFSKARIPLYLALSASHLPFMQTTEIISTVTDYNTTLEFVFAFACILRK